MAKLPETPQWEEEVYQIETSDPVLGGPNGISNRQAKQLANRTTWLKLQQESTTKDLGNYLSKTATADQTVLSTVTFKSNVYSYGEVMIQAVSGKPNPLFRFRDEAGADKGAIYCQTDAGVMNIRWAGTTYVMQGRADGFVSIPKGHTVAIALATPEAVVDAVVGGINNSPFNFRGADAASFDVPSNYSIGTWYGFSVVPTTTVLSAGVERGKPVFYVNARTGVTYALNGLFVGNKAVITTDYGIGSAAVHQDDALQKVGRVYRLNGSSLNKPTAEQSYSAISIPMDGNAIPTVAYLFVSQSGKLRTGISNAATGTALTSYGVWGDYNTTLDANGYLKSASAPADTTLIRSDFPVGIPQPWPTATAPSGWLKCNGATFDKAKYPLLAVAYPSGVLPDLRGEFIRGADDGRGVDSGRTLLSAQTDAVQKFTGKTNGLQHFIPGLTPQGIISQGETVATTTGLTETTGSTGNGVFRVNIDASLQIRTATETRPRNIAFNYIVRAA